MPRANIMALPDPYSVGHANVIIFIFYFENQSENGYWDFLRSLNVNPMSQL